MSSTSLIVCDWLPIQSAPCGEKVLLAAYIVPSDCARRNGSKEFWDFCEGPKIGSLWTGILGGKPSHWKPLGSAIGCNPPRS